MAVRDVAASVKRLVASGQVTTEPAFLIGMLVATDNTNDCTIALYNDADAATAANRVVPDTEFEATAKGLNGFMSARWIDCPDGIYCNIAVDGGGSCEVEVYYVEATDWKARKIK